LILAIGGRVFGYSDAPIDRKGAVFSATVPTSLLVANPTVKVTALFAQEDYSDVHPIDGLDARSRLERLTPIGETADTITYLLYGSRLAQAKVLLPAGVSLQPVGGGADANTLRLVALKKADLKTQKHLVFVRPDERPVVVSIPSGGEGEAAKAAR
jgi:hypothetical protein